MQKLDFHNMRFQQNAATGHSARATIRFGEHVTSLSGPVNWPPRLCDLSPLDNFMWAYVKAHIYPDETPSIDVLEDKIEEFIRGIPIEILERVCQN